MQTKKKRVSVEAGSTPVPTSRGKKAKTVAPESQAEDVRCSSRIGSGSGGQIAQLQNIEHIQMESTRAVRVSHLDVATQGQDVNPMAPMKAKPKARPWKTPVARYTDMQETEQRMPPPAPAPAPTFQLASGGSRFGFRPPSTPPISQGSSTVSTTSTGSTAPTSQSGSIPPVPRSSRASSASAPVWGSVVTTSRSSSMAPAPQIPPAPPSQASIPLWSLQLLQMAAFSQANQVTPPTHASVPLRSLQMSTPSRANQSSSPKHPSKFTVTSQPVPPKRSSPKFIVASQPVQKRSSQQAMAYHSVPELTQEELEEIEADPGVDADTDEDAGADEDEGTDADQDAEVEHSGDMVVDDNGYSDGDVDGADKARDFGEPLSGTYGRNGAANSHNIPVPPTFNTEIDEQSPDKDNRQAQANLHSPQDQFTQQGFNANNYQAEANSRLPSDHSALLGPELTDNAHSAREHHQAKSRLPCDHSALPDLESTEDTHDVLEQHHLCNRAPRPPDPNQLNAKDFQSDQEDEELEAPPSTQPLQPTSCQPTPRQSGKRPHQSAKQCHQSVKQRPHSSHKDLHVKATQLQFFPHKWKDTIERAKQFTYCDAASLNGFPDRTQFLRAKAREYVLEAIAKREAKGVVLPDGIWPKYEAEILWESLGNWQSSMKKRARVFAVERYEWDPNGDPAANKAIALKLLANGGDFLKDSIDEDGRTNNLASPALAGLIVDYFYTGPNSVGMLFPEVFNKETPRPAVALAGTALKAAIDEYMPTGIWTDLKFRVDVYAPTYFNIMGLMAKCDMAPHHKQKTQVLRREWAIRGSSQAVGASAHVASAEFDVVLD
ncbi:hypothetical protein BV22DRAFT_1135273 [Leucogyrophana mollusca]|uniref:Uncharacterized protein n=1 Tax=Leucogyrophana mollusca TaxID=85980 RepID=A0ACB8AVN9_9AGAM|nr:hypothetical protein BV22DRAFT_1135273 [Leucogyrophana mollusca]